MVLQIGITICMDCYKTISRKIGNGMVIFGLCDDCFKKRVFREEMEEF